MKNVLEIDSVQFGWGESLILSNVYLKSETGRVTGVLGRNGCGKSTLFKLIFGDIRTSKKSVRINGNILFGDYLNPAELRMLPQFNFLPKHLKVTSVFRDFCVDYNEFCSIFNEFYSYTDSKICHLSGGNVRIIEIYLILKSNSQFCILDEPFSHLSPINTSVFVDLIRNEKTKKGIIISDHMCKYVVDVSDDLYLVEDAAVLRVGDLSRLVKYGVDM